MSRSGGHGSEERQLVAVFNVAALFLLITNSICSLLATLISCTESLWLTPPSPSLSFPLAPSLFTFNPKKHHPAGTRQNFILQDLGRKRNSSFTGMQKGRQFYGNTATLMFTETEHKWLQWDCGGGGAGCKNSDCFPSGWAYILQFVKTIQFAKR